MYSFPDECASLANLQSFDPAAFRGDEKVPQSICSFVLALAVIHNDCKDTMYAFVLLQQFRPKHPPAKTREWGAFWGLEHHIYRVMFGILHELFDLVKDNRSLLDEKFMKGVVTQLGSDARDAWQTVVDVALEATPNNEFGRALLLVRNKVVFHYDPKAIYKGYCRHFLDPMKLDDRAYISRGLSMKESRFFFADAVGLGYVRAVTGLEATDHLLGTVTEFLRPLNVALIQLIDRFIQKRGFAYRDAEPPQ